MIVAGIVMGVIALFMLTVIVVNAILEGDE
jgi:hypothetical protein